MVTYGRQLRALYFLDPVHNAIHHGMSLCPLSLLPNLNLKNVAPCQAQGQVFFVPRSHFLILFIWLVYNKAAKKKRKEKKRRRRRRRRRSCPKHYATPKSTTCSIAQFQQCGVTRFDSGPWPTARAFIRHHQLSKVETGSEDKIVEGESVCPILVFPSPNGDSCGLLFVCLCFVSVFAEKKRIKVEGRGL